MDEVEAVQNADFLSIALEEYEMAAYGSAHGFVEDVQRNLDENGEEELADHLTEALEYLEDGEWQESQEVVEFVHEELLHRF